MLKDFGFYMLTLGMMVLAVIAVSFMVVICIALIIVVSPILIVLAILNDFKANR